jgi:HlyD family secretion protein
VASTTKLVTGSVVALVLIAGGAWAYAQAGISKVEIISASPGEVVESIAISGRVAAPATVSFLAPESTSVAGVLVAEGQHVEPGQLLVHLDDAAALAQVAQAEAALAQARAGTRELRTVSSKSAAAALDEARAQYEDAERVASQDEKLFSSGTITASQLDRSRTALSVARSRKRAAELAAASTSKRGAQFQSAVAAESFSEAGLVAAKRRAERLSVRAPAAGVVTAREVEVGDDVRPGDPLLTLVLDGKRELVIEPDEKNLSKLSEGQPALASAEAFPDQSFEAKVSYIAPAVDAARGTIEVRLAIPDPPDYLRTDMTVSVDIAVDSNADGATLPRSAVLELTTAQPWVMVLKDGVVERRDVEIGLRGDERVQVLSGLEADDDVIASPGASLAPGDKAQRSP